MVDDDSLYLGLDIGTSSAKCVIVDCAGRVLSEGHAPYDLHSPRDGWAEQDPEAWRRAAIDAARQAIGALPGGDRRIAGIGVTGQMHGLVTLGVDLKPLRPVIIWPDTRSIAQVEMIREVIGNEYIRRTGGPACTGFLLSSLLWLKQTQSSIYHRLGLVLLPKDYVRLWLTGIPCTDPTDACGTGAFDPVSGEWAGDILTALQLEPKIFPEIKPSTFPSGSLLPAAAAEIGLTAGVPVVTGSGDLQAGAVGVGLTSPEHLLINVGTGGQVFQLMEEYAFDPSGRTHIMRHADGVNWHIMSAVLSAGLSILWFAKLIGGDIDRVISRLSDEAAGRSAAAHELYFLPYLLSERIPGANASACFFGLRFEHGRGDLFRAILEGVAFSLRDSYEAIKPMTKRPRIIRAGGGGLRDERFRQLLADVFGLTVEYSEQSNTSALGAALMARSGVTGKPLAQVIAESDRTIRLNRPNPAAQAALAEAYAVYSDLLQNVRRWSQGMGRRTWAGRRCKEER